MDVYKAVIKKFGSVEKFHAFLKSDYNISNFFKINNLITKLENKSFLINFKKPEYQKSICTRFDFNGEEYVFVKKELLPQNNKNFLVFSSAYMSPSIVLEKMHKLTLGEILFFLLNEINLNTFEKRIIFLLKQELTLKIFWVDIRRKEINISNYSTLCNFNFENGDIIIIK